MAVSDNNQTTNSVPDEISAEDISLGTIDESAVKKTGNKHTHSHSHSHSRSHSGSSRKHSSKLSSGMKKKVKTGIVISVFALIILAFGLWMFFENKAIEEGSEKNTSISSALDAKEEAETVYIEGEPFVRKDGIYTVLLFGVDKFGEFEDSGSVNNSQQCDFICLLVFDQVNREYTVLHLNRDTMTPVNVLGMDGKVVTSKVMQLALAHTYGDGLDVSCDNTVNAVSHFLYETKIDSYIAITMDAVEELVDYIGGIKVTIDEDLTPVDESFIEGEEVLMNGEQALKFVRARSSVSDGTNIARMGRQKTFISAVMNTISELNIDKDFCTGIITAISDHMLSDISISKMSTLGDWMSTYNMASLLSPEGENRLGDTYYEFYADDAALKELVKTLFYNPISE